MFENASTNWHVKIGALVCIMNTLLTLHIFKEHCCPQFIVLLFFRVLLHCLLVCWFCLFVSWVVFSCIDTVVAMQGEDKELLSELKTIYGLFWISWPCEYLEIYDCSPKCKNLWLRERIWILEDVARGANEVPTMIIMVGGGTLSSACDSKSPLSHSSDDGEVDH